MYLYRLIVLIVLIFFISPLGYSQKVSKKYQLKQNIKQDQLQYEFQVLDSDSKEPRKYDLNKTYYWIKSQQLHFTKGNASGLLLNGSFKAFYF